jgi:hypothetical protein
LCILCSTFNLENVKHDYPRRERSERKERERDKERERVRERKKEKERKKKYFFWPSLEPSIYGFQLQRPVNELCLSFLSLSRSFPLLLFLSLFSSCAPPEEENRERKRRRGSSSMTTLKYIIERSGYLSLYIY